MAVPDYAIVERVLGYERLWPHEMERRDRPYYDDGVALVEEAVGEGAGEGWEENTPMRLKRSYRRCNNVSMGIVSVSFKNRRMAARRCSTTNGAS